MNPGRRYGLLMIVDRGNNNTPDITNVADCYQVDNHFEFLQSETHSYLEGHFHHNTTKLRLLESSMNYAAETRTVKMAGRRRIDALEMWCFRRMLRIPWTAHRTNESILRQLRIKPRHLCQPALFKILWTHCQEIRGIKES